MCSFFKTLLQIHVILSYRISGDMIGKNAYFKAKLSQQPTTNVIGTKCLLSDYD